MGGGGGEGRVSQESALRKDNKKGSRKDDFKHSFDGCDHDQAAF